MFSSLLFCPEQPRILIVGLGGGTMAHFIGHHFPDSTVDIVEIDGEVVRIADEWFGIGNTGKQQIHTTDGIDYIETGTRQWDVIYMDAYLKPSVDSKDGIPLHLKTVAFFKRLKARVTDNGVVVFNLQYRRGWRDNLASIRAAFSDVRLVRLPRSHNMIVVASPTKPLPSRRALRRVARQLDRQKNWGYSYQDDVVDYIRRPYANKPSVDGSKL